MKNLKRKEEIKESSK